MTIATTWGGLPDPNKVVITISGIDTFLGLVLGISTKSYNNSDAKYDGSINVEQKPDGGKLFSLELNSHPDELQNMSQAVFKVVNNH